jgi:hypothetical protein
MPSSFNEPKQKRKTIPRSLKDAVWDRYIGATNAEGPCYVCKRTIHITDFDCGHNKARAKGGTNNISNLRPICRKCNLSMRTKSIEAFKKPFRKAKSTRSMTKAVTVRDKVKTDRTKQGSEQETKGIDFGNKAKLKDKSQELDVGRGKTEETVELAYSLPLNIDYAHAIHLDLANKEKVKTSAKLEWIPFFRVSYKVNCRYSDPSKTPHPIIDEGVYIVNAYIKTLGEEEETQIFRKELEKTPVADQSFDQPEEYRLIKLDPHVMQGEAKAKTIDYVIQKNTEPKSYEVRSKKRKRGDDFNLFDSPETRPWTLKPLRKDVRIREIQIVYAPKWEIEFQSGDHPYFKSLSGNTGTVFADNITYCSKKSHEDFIFGGRKKNVAVCDGCGQLYVKNIFSSVLSATLGCVKNTVANAQDARRGFAPTISKISALDAY